MSANRGIVSLETKNEKLRNRNRKGFRNSLVAGGKGSKGGIHGRSAKYCTVHVSRPAAVEFDPDARNDFILGFHKRKVDRQNEGKEKQLQKMLKERKEAEKEQRDELLRLKEEFEVSKLNAEMEFNSIVKRKRTAEGEDGHQSKRSARSSSESDSNSQESSDDSDLDEPNSIPTIVIPQVTTFHSNQSKITVTLTPLDTSQDTKRIKIPKMESDAVKPREVQSMIAVSSEAENLSSKYPLLAKKQKREAKRPKKQKKVTSKKSSDSSSNSSATTTFKAKRNPFMSKKEKAARKRPKPRA